MYKTDPDAWSVECCSPSSRENDRQKIAKDMQAYLQAGGTIQQIPTYKSVSDMPFKTELMKSLEAKRIKGTRSTHGK